jgi:hypothetical protein
MCHSAICLVADLVERLDTDLDSGERVLAALQLGQQLVARRDEQVGRPPGHVDRHEGGHRVTVTGDGALEQAPEGACLD